MTVDLTRSIARIHDMEVPVKVVPVGPNSVQIEIAGEILTVEGWPEGLGSPPGSVTVSGEVVRLEVLERSAYGVREVPEAARPRPEPARTPARGPVPVAPGSATPVLPPMPGKVVEVRVRPGQRVQRGEVLLVLEAMKMRNEITSPADGEVIELAVEPGANASTHTPMLFIRPVAPD